MRCESKAIVLIASHTVRRLHRSALHSMQAGRYLLTHTVAQLAHGLATRLFQILCCTCEHTAFSAKKKGGLQLHVARPRFVDDARVITRPFDCRSPRLVQSQVQPEQPRYIHPTRANHGAQGQAGASQGVRGCCVQEVLNSGLSFFKSCEGVRQL
jgi:hypothetical protein